MRSRSPSRSSAQCSHSSSCVVASGPREERVRAPRRRPARGRTRHRPSVSTSTSRREPVAVGGSEARRDRAAQRVTRPAPAATAHVRSISSPSQARRVGVERAASRRAVAGQVGRDHAMRLHQAGDHPHPVRGVRAGPVEQRSAAGRRRPRARRSRPPASVEPPLGDGQAGRGAASASAVDAWHRSSMPATLGAARAAPLSVEPPNLRRRRVVGSSSSSDELVLVRVGGRCRCARTRRAWRRCC